LTLVLVAALLATSPVSLTWKPQVGEQHLYHVSVTFRYIGAPIEFRSNLNLTVVSVFPDGSYQLKSETSDAREIGGDEVQKLEQQLPSTQKYDRNGLPIDLKEGSRDSDPFADLLDHLTEFQSPIHPLAEGGTWKNQVVGLKKGIFSRPRINYTLLRLFQGTDKPYAEIGVRAVAADQSELASGTVLLKRPDNYLYRMEEVIPNFWPEGASESTYVHIVVQEMKSKATTSGSFR
jgi:hypothetical protein